MHKSVKPAPGNSALMNPAAAIAAEPYADDELEQIELHDMPVGCGCKVCRLMATIRRDRERSAESDELLQEAFDLLRGTVSNTNYISVALNRMESLIKKRESRKQKVSPDILKKSVSEFHFSVRVMNRFRMLGIKTIGDLTQKTSAQLLYSRYFGMKSLHEVEYALEELGLSLPEAKED